MTPIYVDGLRKQIISNGFHVVELKSATKVPTMSAWTKLAPRNEAIAQYPTAEALNTGLFLGTPLLLAIDIDCDDVLAAQTIEQATVQILGVAPKRFRANSPRCTLLYRMEARRNYKKIEGKSQAVDFLSGNRQIVCDGLHPSGVPVQWSIDLRSLTPAMLTVATPDRIEYLRQTIGAILGATEKSAPLPSVEQPVATEREKAYAAQALAAEVANLEGLSRGRNAALNAAAHAIGTLWGAGWIEPQAAGQALYDACVRNGYVAKDGHDAVVATLKSGMEAGALKPRGTLPEAEAVDLSNLKHNGQLILPTPPAKRATAPRSIKILRGFEIAEEPITWLWEGYLPKGKLTILAGDGGTGKSTLAFDLAARLTKGELWPDGSRCAHPGNVLIWSSEDDPADTIKPRLMAAGAEQNSYGILQGEDGLAFDPARDLDLLREYVRNRMQGNLSLLIIDPIVSAVQGDMHRSNDVRRSLQQFVDFAAEFDTCVLGITHFSKGTQGANVAQRVIGSQAFSALARMVLVAAKEQDSNTRVFARAKSNNSVDEGGFRYSIEAVTLHRDIVATRIAWGEPLEGSSREILASIEDDERADDSRSQISAAKAFLSEALKDGPVTTKELLESAKEMHGISADTLRRAQKQLGIIAKKDGFQGAWSWRWPFDLDALTQKRQNPVALFQDGQG